MSDHNDWYPGDIILEVTVKCFRCKLEHGLGMATLGRIAGAKGIGERLKTQGWGKNVRGWWCPDCWPKRNQRQQSQGSAA
jgi:hypothetical protein